MLYAKLNAYDENKMTVAATLAKIEVIEMDPAMRGAEFCRFPSRPVVAAVGLGGPTTTNEVRVTRVISPLGRVDVKVDRTGLKDADD
jgi:hypothetical protein